MSIAVCAVIVPSRALRAALYAFAVAHVAAGALVASAIFPFSQRSLLLAACLLAGALCARAAARPSKPRRIDISGLGEIRLTVQQDVRLKGADGAPPQRLLPASTLWPDLLLLLLRDPHGNTSVLVILRDSVDPDAFRALAVACRAIAARTGAPAGT
ncbi:MAG: protein YgfX [Pseudomonadota bacterium]